MIGAFRMNLAKHEAPGRKGLSVPAPGYERINSLCGAMDFEIHLKDGSFRTINRREIADALRAMKLPTR
jgi:hypothetical protein